MQYRLATITHRARTFPVVAVDNALIDFNYGYEFYKQRKNIRNFFKPKHAYTMIDILDEWALFDPEIEAMAEFYADAIKRGTAPAAVVLKQEDVRFRPPMMYPNKILNAGSNYYDHALEMGAAAPDVKKHEPYFFYKGNRHTVIGSGDEIVLTPRAKYIDWEAELALVIGKTAKNVPVDKAMDYIAGFTCYNDVSGRDRMIRHGETFDYDWFANKGNDTFCPMGPYITPTRFMPNLADLRVRCIVNNEVMQDYSTADMVFKIPELVANASSITTLSPGDVIATGTGAGAGMAKGVVVKHGEIHKVFEHMYAGKARLMKGGDRCVVEIAGIGRLENDIVTPETRREPAFPNE